MYIMLMIKIIQSSKLVKLYIQLNFKMKFYKTNYGYKGDYYVLVTLQYIVSSLIRLFGQAFFDLITTNIVYFNELLYYARHTIKQTLNFQLVYVFTFLQNEL